MATFTLHLEPTGLSGTYLTHLAREYDLKTSPLVTEDGVSVAHDAKVFTGWQYETRFTLIVHRDGSAIGLVDSNPSDTMFRASQPDFVGELERANIEEVFMEPGTFDPMCDELHVPITSRLY